MTRAEIVKRLAEFATRPISSGMHQPVATPDPEEPRPSTPAQACTDLFVWFEDTSARQREGRRGIAGLPEALLPWSQKMKVIERRYSEGHLHLLSAVRLRCSERAGERIAALYTAALSVGTVAWIGTGQQYEEAWREMFPYADPANDPANDAANDLDTPDFPSEI